jgi:hypothetical protein
MMALPPETASPSRKLLEIALPAAMMKHARAPSAWMRVRTWTNTRWESSVKGLEKA